MQLIFASTNAHKRREIQNRLPEHIALLTLTDTGFNETIDEPFFTHEENARHKARVVCERTQIPTLAEDSGLCVRSLEGAPGVFSARYAQENNDKNSDKSKTKVISADEKNNIKLLRELENKQDRSAYFVSVFALVYPNQSSHIFSGTCEGLIATRARGTRLFGYDPIFIPLTKSGTPAEQTFGEMTIVEKEKYSHRRRAMDKLFAFLKSTY